MTSTSTLADEVAEKFNGDSIAYCVIAPNKGGKLIVSVQVPENHLDDFRNVINKLERTLSGQTQQ